jgi:uncharacterized protein YegP (UPF0339 family)
MAREPEFKILKNTDGEYYWHLEAAGSRVAARSGQAYTIKQACVNEVYWIKDNASQIMIHDHTGSSRKTGTQPQSPECPPSTPDRAWHRGTRGGMSGHTWRTATNPATTASAPPR